MPRQTGVTETTQRRLGLGPGKLVVNYGLSSEFALGATRGGGSFVLQQTFEHEPEDGIPGRSKGSRHLINSEASLAATLVEFDRDRLLQILTGAAAADSAASDPVGGAGWTKVTRRGDIDDSAYLPNVALVFEVAESEDPAIVLVRNALQAGAITLTTENHGEGTVPVRFEAHFEDEAPDTPEPWELFVPKFMLADFLRADFSATDFNTPGGA